MIRSQSAFHRRGGAIERDQRIRDGAGLGSTIRLFHWLLVFLVAIDLLTGFIAPEWWMGVHAGYGVVALIIFRLVPPRPMRWPRRNAVLATWHISRSSCRLIHGAKFCGSRSPFRRECQPRRPAASRNPRLLCRAGKPFHARVSASLRITEQRWWLSAHRRVSQRDWEKAKFKGNRSACHRQAEQGNFEEED